MGIDLYPHQRKALSMLRVGSILCGGVGSGKSRTSLAYFYSEICGGDLDSDEMELQTPKDLYIITTARKRDIFDWEKECGPFLLSKDPEISVGGVKVTIDSWNNIGKYVGVENAFFIFDEQRVVGSGAWVKSFLKICKKNPWILLSATPGDTWSDYIPVFLANGFYRNRTEFNDSHVVWKRFVKWPQIDKYIHTHKLERLKAQILVPMEYQKSAVLHTEIVPVEYDEQAVKEVVKTRWNPFDQLPIKTASEYCGVLRKITNSHPSRLDKMMKLYQKHRKLIVFYNFDYELELLRDYARKQEIPFSEWNGHLHQPIPETSSWLYLVQYTAGAEGWNCTETDAIYFYSLNYSYKVMVQAGGRIDRLDTPFKDLWLYKVKSKSIIDLAISRALSQKKKFNENNFIKIPTFA